MASPQRRERSSPPLRFDRNRLSCRGAQIAGRVSNVEADCASGRSNVTYEFSVGDQNGAPLLLLAFKTIKEAMACRLQIEAVVGRAKSLIDANGTVRE